MSAPAYESYKDSGVEWLGQVPSHWEINRLKVSISTCKGGIWGDEANNGEDDIICIRVADFSRLDFRITLATPTYRNIVSKDRHGRILKRGDLLIEKSGGGEKQPVGAVALYDHDVPAVCSNFIARLELMPNMHPAYWTYVHAAAYDRALTVRCLNQTSGIQNLDLNRYLDESAPFPPLPEQTAIAAFLDRETGKIDALIEAQTRLIELLKEKRQAVISHAVTKGLNPDAPLKDSGIEWLGQVPAHWEVVAIKRLARLQSGDAITSSEIEFEGEYPVYGGNGFRGFTSKYNRDGYYILIGRQGALCGNINYAEGQFWASEHAIVVHPQQRIETRWFGELLRSMNLGQYSIAAAQPGLSADALGNLRCPWPRYEEQVHIVKAIDAGLKLFEPLIEQANLAVKLFQERRAALISAAVTGKIDVRGLVNIESEAA